MKPQLAFNRDLAIAHRAMIYYGVDSVYREILSRAEPLTPVVGWNAGPESDHVAPPSEYALFNTASDYCSNLTFLSAGAREARLDKARRIDPRKIDFAQPGSYHAFMMSDGDNMQWTMDAFFSRGILPVSGIWPGPGELDDLFGQYLPDEPRDLERDCSAAEGGHNPC